MVALTHFLALASLLAYVSAQAPLVCKDDRDATYCASVKSFCFDHRYVQGMSQMCAKTCGFCTTALPTPQTGPIAPGCKDNHYQGTSYCLRNIIYCTAYYRDSMTRYCAKTRAGESSASPSASASIFGVFWASFFGLRLRSK